MSKVLLLLLLMALPAGLRAQSAAAGVLVEMATHAGVIFAGEVAAVRRHDPQGYVEIEFRVDSAVRGCATGGTYRVREWAGRWLGHSERYRAGQRLLMMLTAPGPAGLSAPVYDTDGAIPIVGGSAGTADDAGVAAEPVVDLRLLAARVVPATAADTRNNLIIVGPVAVDGSTAAWPSLTDVLALLRGGAVAAR